MSSVVPPIGVDRVGRSWATYPAEIGGEVSHRGRGKVGGVALAGSVEVRGRERAGCSEVFGAGFQRAQTTCRDRASARHWRSLSSRSRRAVVSSSCRSRASARRSSATRARTAGGVRCAVCGHRASTRGRMSLRQRRHRARPLGLRRTCQRQRFRSLRRTRAWPATVAASARTRPRRRQRQRIPGRHQRQASRRRVAATRSASMRSRRPPSGQRTTDDDRCPVLATPSGHEVPRSDASRIPATSEDDTGAVDGSAPGEFEDVARGGHEPAKLWIPCTGLRRVGPGHGTRPHEVPAHYLDVRSDVVRQRCEFSGCGRVGHGWFLRLDDRPRTGRRRAAGQRLRVDPWRGRDTSTSTGRSMPGRGHARCVQHLVEVGLHAGAVTGGEHDHGYGHRSYATTPGFGEPARGQAFRATMLSRDSLCSLPLRGRR